MSEEEKKPDANQLNLKVVTQDGNEIFFKCKMTTPLEKLMKAFCNRQGVAMNSVRFLFDGQRLSTAQTPAEVRTASPPRSAATSSPSCRSRPPRTRAARGCSSLATTTAPAVAPRLGGRR